MSNGCRTAYLRLNIAILYLIANSRIVVFTDAQYELWGMDDWCSAGSFDHKHVNFCVFFHLGMIVFCLFVHKQILCQLV